MAKKNLIVFDIDGTLTNSVKSHQKAFTETLHDIGVVKINATYKNFKHHTDSFIAKEIYERSTNNPFSEFKKIEFETLLTNKITSQSFTEIKGAKKLLDLLKYKSDFGICFATGSLRKPAIHKLKSAGIKFKEKQLVASDAIYDRETIVTHAIENALEFYNVANFERIISVGDGLWDLITAQNLNLEFIGIGLKNKEILIKKGAQIVCENLLEFNIKKV